MNKRMYLLAILTIFPVILVFSALFFLPNEIVVLYTSQGFHFADGTSLPPGFPQDSGSKYALFQYTIVPLLFGLYNFLALRKENQLLSASSLLCLLFFNFEPIYRVILAFANPVDVVPRILYNTNIYGIFFGIILLLIAFSSRKTNRTEMISSFITGFLLVVFNLWVLDANNGLYFTLLCILGGYAAPLLLSRKRRKE